MKNLTKILGTGLLVIPCALAVVGCGNTDQFADASVNVKGNYVQASETDVAEFIGADFDIDFTGYKITIKSTSENEGAPTSLDMTALCKVNGETLTDFASKMTVTDIATNTSLDTEVYYPGAGYIYTKMPLLGQEMKIKMPFDIDTLEEDCGLDTVNDAFGRLEDFLEDVKDDFYAKLDSEEGTGDLINISKSGDTTKFQMKLSSFVADEVALTDVNMYLVFNKGTLTGCTFEAKMGTYTQSIVIAEYDGNISYPSFDDYVAFSF